KLCMLICLFFQAEDGIRDKLVTGVQTCALPILLPGPAGSAPRDSPTPPRNPRAARARPPRGRARAAPRGNRRAARWRRSCSRDRSEERRVGKEMRFLLHVEVKTNQTMKTVRYFV